MNEDIVVMFGLPMFGIANTHPDFARQSFTCEGDAGKTFFSLEKNFKNKDLSRLKFLETKNVMGTDILIF